MKTQELKGLLHAKCRNHPDGWITCEFDDPEWVFQGATETREIVSLDVISLSHADITSIHPRRFGETLFCLVETKSDYDSPRKSDRVICGKDEDDVIKWSNEHSLF